MPKLVANICHTDKYVDLSCKTNSVLCVHYLLIVKSMQKIMQSTQQLCVGISVHFTAE